MWHLILHPRYFPHTPMCKTMILEKYEAPLRFTASVLFQIKSIVLFTLLNAHCSKWHSASCQVLSAAIFPPTWNSTRDGIQKNFGREPLSCTHTFVSHFHITLLVRFFELMASLFLGGGFGGWGYAYQTLFLLSFQLIWIGKRKLILSSQTSGENLSNNDISWRLM